MSLLGSLLGRPEVPPCQHSGQLETDGSENRCHDRLPAGTRLTLIWLDHRGRRRSARARVVDMNGTGALVKTGADLLPGFHVYVQAPDFGRMGSAIVRHSIAGLLSYKIGLRFSGPLMHRF